MSNVYLFKGRSFRKYSSDAPRLGTIELTVDWEQLIKHLGTKAAFNRSLKSGIAAGVKVKFIPSKVPA